jgi:uncharacterized protein (TIGR02145 family)
LQSFFVKVKYYNYLFMGTTFKIIGFILLIQLIQSCKKEEVPVLTTSVVTEITGPTAISGGAVTDEGSGAITARGVCWSTNPKPTVSDNKTLDGPGAGNFVSALTDLQIGTTYNVRAYATNSAGTGYGKTLSFAAVILDYDGNSYSAVKIGDQLWTVENLKTSTFNDGTEIVNETDDLAWSELNTSAYCWYQNDATSNKDTYGALYNWYAVNSGKLCPTGWHVPDNDEWTALETFLITNGYNYDGSTVENRCAKALASATGWNSSAMEGAVGNTDYSDKRNVTGFTALPGGVRDANQRIFGSIGNYGMWWTASEDSPATAWDRGLANSTNSIGRLNVLKSHGFSVRCLKD